jgi:hypothetical protein
MRIFAITLMSFVTLLFNSLPSEGARSTPLIVDHRHTNIWQIPETSIIQAKNTLHIAYGHTSHGSQLIDGMGSSGTQLDSFMTANGATSGVYVWHDGPVTNALDLDDYAMGGDVGYYPDWVNNTRSYLGAANSATGRGTGPNADVNVIIWSWCGQAASQSAATMISNYLAPMTQLELDYPGITFVYMTGHLDGTGTTGDLNVRNEQIRTYCRTNNKVLFDFADIESYDPDGLVNYMELMANDNCDYDSDGNGSLDKNWAIDWQDGHTENVHWWASGAAHSQDLNGNRKGYAAWWLWASLAGWDKKTTDLILAIKGLQVVSGLNPNLADLARAGRDVNGDARLGLPEVINSLHAAAE